MLPSPFTFLFPNEKRRKQLRRRRSSGGSLPLRKTQGRNHREDVCKRGMTHLARGSLARGGVEVGRLKSCESEVLGRGEFFFFFFFTVALSRELFHFFFLFFARRGREETGERDREREIEFRLLWKRLSLSSSSRAAPPSRAAAVKGVDPLRAASSTSQRQGEKNESILRSTK